VAAARPGKGGFATIEALGEAIALAVASGQRDRLAALMIPDDEAEAALRASETPEATIPEMMQRLGEVRAQLPRRWERLEADALKLNVRLSELKYVGVVPYRTTRENGLHFVAGDLNVQVKTASGTELVLDVEACIEGPSGWWLAEPEVELELPRDTGAEEGATEMAPTPTVAMEEVAAAPTIQRFGCTACHSVTADGPAMVGPGLYGRFGATASTDRGPVIIDEAYLRESILDPAATITTGYRASMPGYRGLVTDAELEEMVTYIKQLGR
jgi:cytochrome c2